MVRSYGTNSDPGYTSVALESISLFRDVFSYSSDPRRVLAELEGKLAKALAEGDTLEVAALQKQIAAQKAIIRDMEASGSNLLIWNRIGQVAGVAAIVVLLSIPFLLLAPPDSAKATTKRK